MALYKNDIPILEYDLDTSAVIQPKSKSGAKFPKVAVFAFLADEVEKYARARGFLVIDVFESITKLFPIYEAEYKGKTFALCQAPLGAPAAASILDYMIGSGVETVIAGGSCGALTDLPEGKFLIPVEAVRDEGTSYHYLPPARTVKPDMETVAAIERALTKNGVEHMRTKVWTTDGFYRETREMVEYRRQEGCTIVDMECSALMACAEFRHAKFAQMLFTADSLANVDAHDERNWGLGTFAPALTLCFEAALEAE